MKTFLFSIDLEEFYAVGSQKNFRRTPLPDLAEKYLDLLRRHKMRATFFIVGEIAAQFPATVAAIAGEGHELACQRKRTNRLNSSTPASLAMNRGRNFNGFPRSHWVRTPDF